MERNPTLGDWYWRLLRHSALTNLWLSRDDWRKAADYARSFLTSAVATADRTWQALAFEANARVALRSEGVERAQEYIERALAAIEAFEAPVAGWRVHATAADVARARGDTVVADRHRSKSRDIVMKLAHSLHPGFDDLRQTFLGSRAVAGILADPATI